MVGPALALSLIGLGAVQALPSGKQVEERQIWIGDGTGVLIPGDGELPSCLTEIPLEGQPPCLLPPVVGGLEPGKAKREEVKARQIWIGDGTGVFIPGDGSLPTCLTDAPLEGQPPCLLPPIVGGLNPGKRQILGGGGTVLIPGQPDLPPCNIGTPLNQQPPCLLPPISDFKPGKARRQVIIGGGSGTFFPGQGSLPVCATNIPLNQQPPCMLPPIVGGLNPPTLPKEKRAFVLPPDYATNTKEVIKALEQELIRLQNKRYKTEEDLDDIEAIKGALKYLAGITSITAPPGTGSSFTPGKRAFVLPPDSATNTKEVIKRLELELIRLQNKKNKTKEDLSDIAAIKAALKYLAGITKITAPPGGSSTFTPGKRAFVLPPDYATNTKEVIKRLELELIRLQNKKNKTKEDLNDIAAIKAALKYLAGITKITAPPGGSSTFTPGKRGFVLPPDYATNTKEVIKALELELIRLQNKPHKTAEDRDDIEAIKGALKYLAGIVSITAPPGTGSTFTPGKRAAAFNPDTVGTYSAECPNLVGAQLALEALMHKDKPTVEERIVMQKLAAFLKGCGITIVSSPDGTWTIIKPSDKKRDAKLDVAGLQSAYFALLQASSTLVPSQPSFPTWLALQHIGGVLELLGATTTFTIDSAGNSHPKRQANTITIGSQSCALADIAGLRAALAALIRAYGHPSKAPANIFLIEQVLVAAIQLCGQGVDGWTTLVPGSTIPGGPIIPDTTVPGGAITPDPTIPGGEIKPSDKRKRQAPVGDPAALLTALKTLEDAYGKYGSGTIPVPVWLIMVNVVTILQSIPGVVVPGWPILGQGSVVLTPST